MTEDDRKGFEMPKQKTRKCVAKRVKQTASGKYLRKRAGVRHLNSTKNAKRKRRLGKDASVDVASRHTMRACLPYGLR